MNLVEYWKKRCELAEAYIEENPCDPDIYKEQLDAWKNWCDFKKLPIPVVVERSSQLKAFVDWWHGLSQEELVWYEGRYVEVFLSL